MNWWRREKTFAVGQACLTYLFFSCVGRADLQPKPVFCPRRRLRFSELLLHFVSLLPRQTPAATTRWSRAWSRCWRRPSWTSSRRRARGPARTVLSPVAHVEVDVILQAIRDTLDTMMVLLARGRLELALEGESEREQRGRDKERIGDGRDIYIYIYIYICLVSIQTAVTACIPHRQARSARLWHHGHLLPAQPSVSSYGIKLGGA